MCINIKGGQLEVGGLFRLISYLIAQIKQINPHMDMRGPYGPCKDLNLSPPQHQTSLMQHIIFILERRIESRAIGLCWNSSGVRWTPLLIYHRQLRHEM